MNKEDVLLKSYSMLAKDPKKNADALESAVQQLIAMNPKLGIRCWEECIKNNFNEIEVDFGKSEFAYKSTGRILIKDFESRFCEENNFAPAVGEFAKNKFLLEVLYTKSPIDNYFSGPYVISYLIRSERFQEADNILSAIYKNKVFNAYSNLWDKIIEKFRYEEVYHPGVYSSILPEQSEDIQDFCMSWIERIKDEEEQAGAMTFAMQMYE